MKRVGSIILYSVIAAAFLGPGTVTTSASAGAQYGFTLLWALVFSTVACVVLQEAAGRLTAISGHTLGEALRRQYPSGLLGALVVALVFGAVVIGCAAFEAGNILGGVSGARLVVGLDTRWLTLLLGGLSAVLLWRTPPRAVARSLSVLVAVMGVAFLLTAVLSAPDPGKVVAGLMPSLPSGAGLLALGLVGTTVVPYNLFLGSSLAEGDSLSSLRLGLAVSVGLGGLISMAVLVVGTGVTGEFSFEALQAVLASRLGAGASNLVGVGLLAAGFSSAITAPLAAALTARGLFGGGERWSETSWRYRAVWGGVLATGVAFGVSQVKPVPVIILAQALNGVILPLVGIFLLLAVNDRKMLGEEGLNGSISNTFMGLVVAVAVVLGTAGVSRAMFAAIALPPPSEETLLRVAAVVLIVLAGPVLLAVRRRR